MAIRWRWPPENSWVFAHECPRQADVIHQLQHALGDILRVSMPCSSRGSASVS